MCVPGGRGEGWVRTRARETIVVESAGLKPTQVSKHRSPFLRNAEAGVRTLPALGGGRPVPITAPGLPECLGRVLSLSC